jgi:VanZ family protein
MISAAARRLLYWGLVAAWLTVIWQFGESQVLPLTSSDGILLWLLRKGFHLAVYGVLGRLLALALGPHWQLRWVIIPCLLVALGDELHQRSVPNRSFQAYDLGIDLLGVVLGMSFRGKALYPDLWWKEEYPGV